MDVGVGTDSGSDIGQHRFPFRVIGHSSAGQDETAIEMFLHHSVGCDRSDRIFKAIEARHL